VSTTSPSLAAAFLAALPRQADEAEAMEPAALEEQLASTLAAARKRWPGVELSPLSFVTALASRVSGRIGSPAEALAELHGEDLYLACACLAGDEAAWTYLERELLAPLEQRLSAGRARSSDVYDAVREHLVSHEPSRPSILGKYAATSGLRGWLNGVVRRKEHEVRRRARRWAALGDEAVDRSTAKGGDADRGVLLRAEGDPEAAAWQRRFSVDFKEVLAETLASFSMHDRAVLERHLVQRQTVDELATTLRVHRATAARRVATLREKLRTEIHDRLTARLGLESAEAGRMREHLAEETDLSLARLLAAPRGALRTRED